MPKHLIEKLFTNLILLMQCDVVQGSYIWWILALCHVTHYVLTQNYAPFEYKPLLLLKKLILYVTGSLLHSAGTNKMSKPVRTGKANELTLLVPSS